jgi:hypothetical protein
MMIQVSITGFRRTKRLGCARLSPVDGIEVAQGSDDLRRLVRS